jgi:hypothetical protein
MSDSTKRLPAAKLAAPANSSSQASLAGADASSSGSGKRPPAGWARPSGHSRRASSAARRLAWWPSASEPLWTIVTTWPGRRPQAQAALESRTPATYCSSAKWLPPPTLPIMAS